MKTIPVDDQIKLFCISNQLTENALDRVERDLALDLGRNHNKTVEKDQDYYPQIDDAIRREAANMSAHYEVFYSLEKSIRSLIVDTLEAGDLVEQWSDSSQNQIRRRGPHAEGN
jgi:hypothetical protein